MTKKTKTTERQEMILTALKYYKKGKDIEKLERVLNKIFTSGGFNEDGSSNKAFFIKEAIRLTKGNVVFVKGDFVYKPKKDWEKRIKK